MMSGRNLLSRLLAATVVAGGTLTMVPTVAAHEGISHADTPHWVLLGVVLVGLSIISGSLLFDRTVWTDCPYRTLSSLLVGLVVTAGGIVGLTQIQIEPISTAPIGRQWFPVLTGVAGLGILTATLVLGISRWLDRPRYSVLGTMLGLWVLYPTLLPGSGLTHPLGYFITVAVPLMVGYILWNDVWPALTGDVVDALARRVSLIVATLVTVFLLFSAGLFTVNPDEGVNAPTTAFVTVAEFADPLVVWPAVEFYLPSIPLAGAMSVGTTLLIGLLVGLVAANTALVTTVWQRNLSANCAGGVLGTVATTGATACCCCGPAAYALTSSVLGLTASPLYWAFVDPTSPVGSLFFVGAVALLTRNAIELSDSLVSAKTSRPSSVARSFGRSES